MTDIIEHAADVHGRFVSDSNMHNPTEQGCWEWKGMMIENSINPKLPNICAFRIGPEDVVIAQRFSYELMVNDVSDEEWKEIEWKCKNPICVNPQHAHIKEKVSGRKYSYNSVGVTQKYIKNFMDRVSIEENGCHIWLGKSRNGSPMGSCRPRDSKKALGCPKRIAFLVHNREIPFEDGLSLVTKCGNRLCVNPDHIVLATSDENPNKTSRDEYLERFYKYVKMDTHTDCHIWIGSIRKTHAVFRGENGVVPARRWLWETKNQTKISKSKCIYSTCGRDNCVNLDHMLLLTKAQIMTLKESHNVGMENHSAKLTDDDVRYILREWETNPRRNFINEMMKKFDVGFGTVHKIINRKSWRHIEI